jgi:pantoate--beta-alanine ligase
VELFHKREDLSRLGALRRDGELTLVPTMGALHAGHLSLVDVARRYGPVVVSIFVNPLQFGPQEDFAAYPRELASDLALLEPRGVAAVFAPSREEMFGADGGDRPVRIVPGSRGSPLCGRDRPGHFGGVLTVVAKLFHLVQPTVAVFGRKDAQQCLVIEQMVRDLDFPVRLVDGPTVREEDGLALSSRNRYLSPQERRRAGCLRRSLLAARQALVGGERRAVEIVSLLQAELAPADAVEYAEVRSVPELEPLDRIAGHVILAVAARLGRARLIDNLVLEVAADGVAEAPLMPGADR